MAAMRWAVAAAALASALLAQPARAQSIASLTHTVSVTVPPRVQAQVSSTAEQRGIAISPTDGQAVSISVNATRSWALSIASRGAGSSLQWSSQRGAGFSQISRQATRIAAGKISAAPATSLLFVRTSERAGRSGGSEEGEAVVLTMVAP
jgi:hypothetical protein